MKREEAIKELEFIRKITLTTIVSIAAMNMITKISNISDDEYEDKYADVVEDFILDQYE